LLIATTPACEAAWLTAPLKSPPAPSTSTSNMLQSGQAALTI
jgi:hypothetical protein